MAQIVQLPDGGTATFPDEASLDQIKVALAKYHKPSSTPETDKAVTATASFTDQLKRLGVDTTSPESLYDPKQHPIAENAASGATELLGGFVPKSVDQYAKQLFPVLGMYDTAKHIGQGDFRDVPFVGRVQDIQDASKTPDWSKERFLAAGKTLMDIGLLAGIGEGGINAGKISKSASVPEPQVRTRLGETPSLRPEGETSQAQIQTQGPQAQTILKPEGGEIVNEGIQKESVPQQQTQNVGEQDAGLQPGSGPPEGNQRGPVISENREGNLGEGNQAGQQLGGNFNDPLTGAGEQQTPPAPTSTKNAAVEASREARGLDPIEKEASRSFPRVWGEVDNIVSSDPHAPERLAAEISQKPRPISDTENGLLIRRLIDAKKEHDAAVEAVNSAPNETALAEAQVRLEAARDNYSIADQAATHAGTKLGQGLNARKMLVNDDYSLAKMEATKRAANGGKKLSPEQLAEVKLLNDRMEVLQKQLTKYEAKERMQGLIREAKKSGKGRTIDQYLEEQARSARERLKDVVCEI